jgi:hypothetical protein
MNNEMEELPKRGDDGIEISLDSEIMWGISYEYRF